MDSVNDHLRPTYPFTWTETALGKLWSASNQLKLFTRAPLSISLFCVLQFPHPILLNVSSLLALCLLQSGQPLHFKQLALRLSNRRFIAISGAKYFLLVTVNSKIQIKDPRQSYKYQSTTNLLCISH